MLCLTSCRSALLPVVGRSFHPLPLFPPPSAVTSLTLSFHTLLHVLRVVHWLLLQQAPLSPLLALSVEVVQISIGPVLHIHVAILLWSALAQCLSVDAIVLCVLLRIPGRDPAEAVFESTYVASRSRSCPRCVWLRASWSVGTSRRRHAMLLDPSACLVEPSCCRWSSSPSRACAGSIKNVRRRVRSPLACREALLKVVSLLRAARSELLCRCRRFIATASSTPLA